MNLTLEIDTGNQKQIESVKKDTELSKNSEFRTKALTPSIISAWSFTAGLLQSDKSRLEKLFKVWLNGVDMMNL